MDIKDKHFLSLVKNGLLELKEGNVRDKRAGICYNVSLFLPIPYSGYVYQFVKNYCVGWDGIERPTDFPVSGYFGRWSKWRGEQLEKRLSLIDHLIVQCDKLLEEEE